VQSAKALRCRIRFNPESILPRITDFLWARLKLTLHPNKISIRTIASGVDYLGWINFPDHRVLRTITKKRMFRGISLKKGKPETMQSYLGFMSHGNSKKLKERIEALEAESFTI
jgi:hypothetical protein